MDDTRDEETDKNVLISMSGTDQAVLIGPCL